VVAGDAAFGALEQTSPEELRPQPDTNVVGVHRVTRAVLPAMRARRAGAIVKTDLHVKEIRAGAAGRSESPARPCWLLTSARWRDSPPRRPRRVVGRHLSCRYFSPPEAALARRADIDHGRPVARAVPGSPV